MGPRLGLHVSARAVRALILGFVAAFIGTLGRTESGVLEEGADGLWWLIFPQQAGGWRRLLTEGR